ncbi:MAG: hypothetical protein KDK91_13225 [Gammaproteobacteria bacterium]|nr:hypothetical protein [Gammaproteobacteria bacterium]
MASDYDWIEHDQYEIAAAPIREGSGWRVAGAVSKLVDGQRHVHCFVRADVCQSRDDAEQISLTKARLIVAQGGPSSYESTLPDTNIGSDDPPRDNH